MSEQKLSDAWQCQSCGCYFPHIPKVLDNDVKRCSKCVEVEILETELKRMERALKEAYPFVESAGYADNSGGEYLPHCQECEPFIGDDHTKDCQLNTWLEANKALGGAQKE